MCVFVPVIIIRVQGFVGLSVTLNPLLEVFHCICFIAVLIVWTRHLHFLFREEVQCKTVAIGTVCILANLLKLRQTLTIMFVAITLGSSQTDSMKKICEEWQCHQY